MTLPPSSAGSSDSLFSAFLPLLPLTSIVFVTFLAPGMALPAVPLHVHDALGFSTVVVGVVMGIQFASSVFARLWAGHVADGRGTRFAVIAGLLGAVAVGTTYVLSTLFVDRPAVALGLLVAARLMTGVAESFVMTALLGWGIARMGPAHAGKVIGWIGMFLFGAYAAGAPMGMALHARFGFAGVAWATVAIPLAALAMVLAQQGTAPSHQARPSVWRVVGAIRLPGLGLMLCSLGYATLSAFITLLFARRGWGGAALALTSLGAGFIAARLPFGHLPDKIGGARIALRTVLLVALGQFLIFVAGSAVVACLGAALTGAGYALAFQGFGVEAVRRTPPESRSAAMGAYVAFQDVAMGLGPPLGGVLAAAAGLSSVYLAASIAAVASAAIARKLLEDG